MSEDDVASDGEPSDSLVVVVGAGFSKAVDDGLPTTDELGEAVRQRLRKADGERLPGGRFRGGRFEEWLSYLAEDQPHLAEDRSFEDRALLRRVTETMREVLSAQQVRALASGAPDWFYEMLSVLQVLRATVVSLNYDNLIECGVETGHGRPGANPAAPMGYLGTTEDDVLGQLPRLADLAHLKEIENRMTGRPSLLGVLEANAAIWRAPRVPSFRLLKLHGSLSWYWVRGDATGSTLQRWYLPGTFDDPRPDDGEERVRALPAAEPFIVPPAALKSEYLRNPVVRELWRRAYRALMGASRVVLAGYSLPAADLAMNGMVAEALSSKRRAARVEVVNLRPAPVAARLRKLGVPNNAIMRLGGRDCLQQWTEAEREALATEVVGGLRDGQADTVTGDELLFVMLDGQRGVARVVPDSATRDVVVEVAAQGRALHQTLPAKELISQLENARRVVVAFGGRRLVVIHRDGPTKGAMGMELRLVPAGRIPPGSVGRETTR